MSLSMREGFGGGGGGFREPVDLTPFENVAPDTWVNGKVARLAPFGAFVTVTAEGKSADGLVHITQIRDGFVESVEDELSVGQEVEVRIDSDVSEAWRCGYGSGHNRASSLPALRLLQQFWLRCFVLNMARSSRSSRSTGWLLPVLLLAALTYVFSSLSFAPLSAGPRLHSARGTQGLLGLRSRVISRARGGEESEKLAVGETQRDVVSALCPDDSQWYPGTIEKINDDSTYCVKWDDPEGGPETHDATRPGSGLFWPGEMEVPLDGPLALRGIRKIVIFKDYKVGEQVEAVFPDDGYWYPGDVTKVGDGTFTVKWEDPDGGPEESEVGQKYQGTVKSVLDFGAFVDIGAESDGLLHISRISQERIENIYDVLSEGQQVDVWISGKREDEGEPRIIAIKVAGE
eukprot:s3910_g5.t1